MYLYVSYFAAVIFGLVFAIVITAILRKPHRQATTDVKAGKLGTLIRSIFPSWLILTILLAFISVSYFDCSHTTYQQVIEDRDYLVNKTQEQISNILMWLVIALLAYCFILVLFLWAKSKQNKGN